ncbi:hypothetical protein LJR030_000284 [Rhizobium sp. LjRoot30]|uniref:hypothetical protein n=1 Tax=Rhizobium sp. LjRoot30 TaxID=3342320 RepID=UPI003ECE9FB6
MERLRASGKGKNLQPPQIPLRQTEGKIIKKAKNCRTAAVEPSLSGKSFTR